MFHVLSLLAMYYCVMFFIIFTCVCRILMNITYLLMLLTKLTNVAVFKLCENISRTKYNLYTTQSIFSAKDREVDVRP